MLLLQKTIGGDLDPSDNILNSGGGSIDYLPWWGANYVGDSHATPWEWYVDTSENSAILQGIGAASDGDTINVAAGSYPENVTISKQLTLQGNNSTINPNNALRNSESIVNGQITVYSGNVSIKGFTVTNPLYSGVTIKGIYIYNIGPVISNITIQNNILKDIVNANTIGSYGIMVQAAVNEVSLLDNQIDNINSAGWAHAIEVTPSSGSVVVPANITITGNKITNISNTSHTDEYAFSVDAANSTNIADASQITFHTNEINGKVRNLDPVHELNAISNNWGVTNLDEIEAMVNQNCTTSPFVHGVCDVSDNTSYGYVKYANIGTPTNSGWNVGSKSSTPNETPLDIACGGYTNENNVAQNWSAVNGTNIKYQREVTFPSSSISNIEAGSNTYTPFSTFGSATGIEGLWKTKVRAYVDANSNNKYDFGEEVSGWSNECNITFDKTAPSVPINGAPNNTSIPTNNFDFTWNASSDVSSITYEFQSSLNPAQSGGVLTTGLWKSGTLTSNMIHSSGAPDGTWYWQVRAIDSAGNTSAWSSIWNVTLDKVFPTVDLVFLTPGPSATSFQAVFSENVVQSEAENPANYFLNNWPGVGGSGDLVGDATISYDSSTKTSTVTLTNSGWYISPEQQWGVQNVHDLAGNVMNLNPYSETSTSMVAPITTDSGTDTNWHNTSVIVNLSCTDTSGSGCKNTYYTTDGTTPTTSSTSSSSVTLNTDGIYTIKYFSVDNAGNVETIKTASNTVKIDKTAPESPTVTSSSHTLSTWSSDRTIDVSWSASDFSGIVGYSYQWSTSPTTNPDTVSEGISTTTTSGNRATNQSIYFHIKTLDGAGNWSSVTHYGPFWVDANNPTGSWTTPLVDSYLRSTINLEVLPNDVGSGVKHVVFKIKKTGGSYTTISTDTTSPYQGSLDTTTKTDGTYVLRAQIVDDVNRSINKDINITIDNTVPTFSTKTTFSSWHNTNQTSTFTYTDTNGVVSGNDPTCDITTEGLAQTCSITPNVCDAAGNCNTTIVTSNGANIDKTKPTSTISTPTNNGTNSVIYNNSWDGSIAGSATDALSDIDTVKVSIQKDSTQYFDGSNFVTTGSEILLGTTYTAGNWTYNGLTSPGEGTYTIKSHAIDNAGNVENTYTLTIIYDKTIPEVALSINPATGDASNGWYKTQPEVTLTATDTNIDKIEYQWDSQTGSWIRYSAPFKPANEGGHVLYYKAKDLAGNYSDVGIKNISWDQTELELAPQNVSADPNPTSGSTSKISWSAAKDNVGIDKYEVKWTLNDTANPSSYSLTVGSDVREKEIDQLTEGRWTVSVRAFDSAGNSKDTSIDLHVDRTGPTAPTLTLEDVGVGTATLSWTAVTDATDYIVWYGNTSGSRLFGARVGNVTSYTVRGLGTGNYYFVVKAVDEAQNQGAESNEINTGAILGAPGVEEGAPAEGFTPEVLGTETEATPSPTPETTPEILGSTTDNKNNYWWWLLLLIPLGAGGFFIFKKK